MTPAETVEEVVDPDQAARSWPEMAPDDRDVELARLKQSIAEMKAGYPGRPLDEVMAEIAAKYNLPPVEQP